MSVIALIVFDFECVQFTSDFALLKESIVESFFKNRVSQLKKYPYIEASVTSVYPSI